MIKLEKDVLDFHMNLSLSELRMEISKNESFVKNHPRVFRFPKEEIDFYLLSDRLAIIRGIHDFRTGLISEREFKMMFQLVK